MGQRLIIFTRYPEPGKTKTRLIPVLGPDGASALQRRMTERILGVVKQLAKSRSVSIEVRYEGGGEHLIQQWLGPNIIYSSQTEGDLGQRMAVAFNEAFQTGMDKVVLVGTDCPGLTIRHLQNAFDALNASQVVLGPARDGGYYLIGLRKTITQLFTGISWGTPQVLEQTTRIADELGLSVALVDTLDDVDRPEDIPAWEKATESRISIIIPALNEAENIVNTLESIRRSSEAEIIVVDGGSCDETLTLARSCGAKALISLAGRARQMNAGAERATGDVLLFLHADTLLPEGFEHHVRQILALPGTAAGAFELHIDDPLSHLRMIEKIANLRSRKFQMPYGDQAIFLKAELFQEVGGFPDIPIMEDFELVRRLRRKGRIVIAPVAAVTSARRWRKVGIWKTTLINQGVIAAYFLGVSPWRICQWYNKNRGIS